MLCKKLERLILSNGIFNGYSGEGSEAAELAWPLCSHFAVITGASTRAQPAALVLMGAVISLAFEY